MGIPRSLAARLLGVALIVSACTKGTDAPVPTTILVTPSTLTFGSIGATQTMTAKVLDQRGDSMPGLTITWSTSAASVVTVSSAGVATSQGNGTATVTATVAAVTKDVPVSVAQVPAFISKTGGDGQSGTVGVALALPLAVHVTDGAGAPIQGLTVTFAVTQGGGSLSATNASTDGGGNATANWTLGTVAGAAQGASATAGSLSPVSFSASAAAGPVAAVVAQAGDNQTRAVGSPVPIAPSVKVTDSFGNAKSGVQVVFSVTAGGGSVTGGTQTTNAGGIATVGSWTMGAAAGANSLQAVAGTANHTFTATAVTVGAPTNMAVLAGNNQTALIGYRTNIRPAVVITDANAQPVSGVSVTFAVQTGGGGVTNAVVNTNNLGIAQVGSWVVGASAGSNTVTATAAPSGITGNPVMFTATGAAPAFNITLQNTGPAFSAAVQAAFDSAAAFWQRVIYGDIPDIAGVSIGANQCGNSAAIGPVNVDDVLILAKVDSIDGPGKILGQAGPCFIRTTGRLTIAGAMVFDSADITGLVNNGSLNEVIRHEMGHVLGFGTLWDQTAINCIQNKSNPPTVVDTYFSCARTTAAFDSIGGISYTGGLKVPVENCGPTSPTGCGQGTVNSHWREPTFGNELMTGYLNSGANPASLITITAMEDIGYTVNYGAVEPYSRTFSTAPALRAAAAVVVNLGEDVLRQPIYVMDGSGRITGVVRR